MSRYYKITLPEMEYNPIYSVKKVEQLLKKRIVGNELMAIFVSAQNLDYARVYDDYADFTMMGGKLLFSFKDFTLCLVIHAEGLMEYCIFPAFKQLNLEHIENVSTEEGHHHLEKNVFYDLENIYGKFDYGLVIENCQLEAIDQYPFHSGFDKEKLDIASDRNDLPKKLVLETKYIDIHYSGDYIEYFHIYYYPKDNDYK